MINRQIHLDFHTSGLIGGVGARFDAAAFVKTLTDADVAGICVFARCHHGYCYYPTGHGTPHPHLAEHDLLGKQLKACRDAGIEAYLYTTICWDEVSANAHPEWLARTPQNEIMKTDPYQGGQASVFEPGWQFLCWNSPYREYFKDHLRDLLKQYTCEYLILDILFHQSACVCPQCIERMKKHDLDPENPADQERNSVDSAREFMTEVNALIASLNPAIKPFYNSRLRVTGRVDEGSVPEMGMLGYLCIESLPSGLWGYDHFPVFSKYFQNYATPDKPIMGHTGKFQKMWGDFGGLKNQAALDYEVMRMVSHGVAPSVGDQLHPNGVLDQATYKLIGNTFKKIKPLEEYLIPSSPIDEIGVLLTNAPKVTRNIGTELDAETGAMKLLTQLQYQFSFLDETADFSKYKALILPDEVCLTEPLTVKITDYLKNGGKLLASYNSGLDQAHRWAIPQMDIQIDGEYPYRPYYIYPTASLLQEQVMDDTDYVQYLGGKQVTVSGAEWQALVKITDPYFNRTWDHFSSHAQTPPAKRTNSPEMLYNGDNGVYFASPVFTCYHRFSPKVIKRMVDFGIRRLLGEKLVESNLPSTAEVTYRQNARGQHVLTVLHYIPQRRAEGMDVVEDTLPLYDVTLSLRCDPPLQHAVDLTSGQTLSIGAEHGRVTLTLPKINGVAVVVLQ